LLQPLRDWELIQQEAIPPLINPAHNNYPHYRRQLGLAWQYDDEVLLRFRPAT
jgi:hypothetical protein